MKRHRSDKTDGAFFLRCGIVCLSSVIDHKKNIHDAVYNGGATDGQVIHTRHTTHTSIFQVHIGMFSHTRHTGHTSKKQVHIEI